MVVDNMFKFNNFGKLIFSLVLIFSTNVMAEKIYKWTDEQGTVHYSKNPPPDNYREEELKIYKQRKGDSGCCSLVRRVINSMLSRSGQIYGKDHDLLVNSEDFSATELNNFVSSQVRSNVRNSRISQTGYNKCINAGFNFCRAPIGSFDSSGEKNQGSSGSGFYVSDQGYIVTNEHVVRSCKKIRIEPHNLTARLIAKDSHYDLALLKVNTSDIKLAVFRIDYPVLGEEIVTAGFPYKDILSSSIKITTGIISSLAGIRNDKKVMQITAPIQPGNSGGPLIDIYGNIVGIIVSKLNSEFMIRLYKDIPQNVNFAIKGNYVKQFLTKNGIQFNQTSSKQKKDVTAISQAAQDYTVEINCLN